MIILDHNIPEDQAQQLRRRRIHFRQIGFEAVPVLETAHYISKLLRHPHFNTRAKRNGKVIKVSTMNVIYWVIGQQRHSTARW